MSSKRYAVRRREGLLEAVWIDHVRDGFWRGSRLPDGLATRGQVASLLGRFETYDKARRFIQEKPDA